MKPQIGITGGIGSGKTLITGMFEVLGIPVYRADDRGKYLLANNEEVKAAVVEAFGSQVYVDGKPDRKALAAVVFADKDKLAILNGIIHPAVAKDYSNWVAEQQDAPYTLKEAAILFESGSHQQADKVILVTAPEAVRLARVMERDGATEDEVRARMAKQWPDAKKEALADFVIRNDGEQLVIPQVMRIHEQILAQS